MKKTISAVLALLLVLSMVQFAAAVEMPQDPELPEGEMYQGFPHDEGPMHPEDMLGDGNPVEPQQQAWTPESPGQEPPEGWDEFPEQGNEGMPVNPPAPDQEDEFMPGITPDHKFLWNLELALERLDIAMTFSDSEKAKKKLAHAMERIAEAKEMVEQKMFDDAQNAQQEHDAIIKDLEKILKKLKGETGPEELNDITELEEELEDYGDMVDGFKDEFKDDLNGWENNLSPAQKAQLEELVSQFGASIEDIEIKVNAKKDRVIIKMTLAKNENDSEEPSPQEGLPDDQLPGDFNGPGQEEPEFLEEPEWID